MPEGTTITDCEGSILVYMYKIAICEDDKDYIEYIKQIILKTDIVEEDTLLFYDFYSGEQF